MKVIDILNKIANGEEVPKKIRVGNSAFELSLVELNGSKHYSGNTESVLNNVLGMAKLNEEVEIIEKDKKIEKLIPTSLKGIDDLDEKIEVAHIDTISAIDKINEIIDYIKKEKEND